MTRLRSEIRVLTAGRRSRPDHTLSSPLTVPPVPLPKPPAYSVMGFGGRRAAAPGALIRYLLLSFTWAPQGGRAGL